MMVNDVRAQEFTYVYFFTITCNTDEKINTVEPPVCSLTGGVRSPEGEKKCIRGHICTKTSTRDRSTCNCIIHHRVVGCCFSITHT